MNFKRSLLLILRCLLPILLIEAVYAQEKVLFIGNSFTIGGSKSVPVIFDALAIAAGQIDPTTVMRAVGGKDYEYHYNNSLTEIQSNTWTRVVMQNYSTQPTHIGNVGKHLTYGGLLYDAIIANNGSTRVHLYQTWARAEAHSMISGTSTGSTFATTDEMLGELVSNYQALADTLNMAHPGNPPVMVNPIGEAWNHSGANLPASDPNYIDLWSGDNYHGDNRGYYLSACVHYASIYRTSPEGLHLEDEITTLGLGISDTDAAFLETIAWKTVLSKGLIDQTLRVDFGDDAMPTINSGTEWNNVTASIGVVDNAVLSDMVDIWGAVTTIDLTILSRFNSAFSDGSTSSTAYVMDATSDTLYGNTGLENGLENITPQFKLSSLDPSTAYTLTFYASGADTGDHLQTRYTVVGDRSLTVDLDAAGNDDNVASTGGLYPDVNGEIVVTLTPGPDNDSPTALTRIGVLELTAHVGTALEMTTHPQSQTVPANNPVTFTAEVSADRFPNYQWYRDGIAIPDATNLSYTLAAAPVSYQGSQFTVRASNGVFEVESNPATLTLEADIVDPEFLSVSSPGMQLLDLQFSEPMSSATATDPANYQVVNQGQRIQVTAVTLSSDGLTVQLTLAEPTKGNVIVESSENLTDLSGNPLSSGNVQSLSTSGADAIVLIDFGTTYTASSATDTWNVFGLSSTERNTAGNGTGTPYEYSVSLLDTTGGATGIALHMTDTMTGVNNNGTQSGPYVTGATGDSFYGNTGVWSGFTDNAQGVFVFSNLDVAKEYDFTFFGSRTGASDNRETHYELVGATTQSTDLNVVNNISNTVSIIGMVPDANGEITLTISAGPNNDNSNGFYYLNVLEIGINASDALLFTPVLLNSGVVVDWVGGGTLYRSEDLTLPWTAVDPVPSPPYVEPAPSESSVFYKLEY